jgi:Flp pilus assembly protein TadG
MKSNFRASQLARAPEKVTQSNNEQGQSLLELAITLPILILVLVAIIDFSRAFDAYIVITNAVREGARFGSRVSYLTETDIEDIVIDDILGSGTNVTLMSDITGDDVDVILGSDAVTVTVNYNFPLWFGAIVGVDTLGLTKESVMPVMNSP